MVENNVETMSNDDTKEITEDIKDAVEEVSEDLQSETAQSDHRIYEKLNDIHIELVRLNSRYVDNPTTKAVEETSPVTEESEKTPEAVELTLDQPHDIPKEESEKQKKKKRAFRR